MVDVAQLVEPRIVISGCRGFESHRPPHFSRRGLLGAVCRPACWAGGARVRRADAAPPSFSSPAIRPHREYNPNPKNQQGWGAVLQPLFDESKLRVVDAARGGRSSRTFITEGHWDRMLADVHAGDFVIIQFGHNDSGAVNEEPPGSTRPLRARGTIPGIGNDPKKSTT